MKFSDAMTGYVAPPEVFYQDIWKEAEFVLDANVLLDLYRFSEESRQASFSVLSQLAERIWIPAQVIYEYRKNRIDEIVRAQTVGENVVHDMENLIGDIQAKFDSYKRHPLIDGDKIRASVIRSIQAWAKQQTKVCSHQTSLLDDDPILRRLIELFEDRIGDPFDEKMIAEIEKEGAERYKRKVPPGYKDAGKDGPEKYGDLIIWKQMINHAKYIKRPLIFVTGDAKEDWWQTSHGKTIGPRPELAAEMRDECGVAYYQYNFSRFVTFASQHLEAIIDQHSLDDIEAVEHEEARNDKYEIPKMVDVFDDWLTVGGLRWKLSEINAIQQRQLDGLRIPLSAMWDAHVLNLSKLYGLESLMASHEMASKSAGAEIGKLLASATHPYEDILRKQSQEVLEAISNPARLSMYAAGESEPANEADELDDSGDHEDEVDEKGVS